MNKNKHTGITISEQGILLIGIIVTALLLIGGIFFVTKTTSTPQVATTSNAKAYTMDPTSFDWGTIQYSGPKATKIFTIKNTGSDILKLYNIKTSCHCTNAYVTIDNQDSPRFGMSGVSSWVGEVKPGNSAKLTVIFDQSYHGPQAVGPITRYISVETNDSGIPKLTFTVTGTVVK